MVNAVSKERGNIMVARNSSGSDGRTKGSTNSELVERSVYLPLELNAELAQRAHDQNKSPSLLACEILATELLGADAPRVIQAMTS